MQDKLIMKALVSLEMVPMIISSLFIISRGWTHPNEISRALKGTLANFIYEEMNNGMNEWMKAFRDIEISR